jgi:hypothetical protein
MLSTTLTILTAIATGILFLFCYLLVFPLLFWFVSFSLLVPLLFIWFVDSILTGGSYLLFDGSRPLMSVLLPRQLLSGGCCSFQEGQIFGLLYITNLCGPFLSFLPKKQRTESCMAH